MKLLTSSKLESMSAENKRRFQELLPEIVKRLIISSCGDAKNLRFPSGDDIWAPGYDGVVDCETSNRFVNSGKSVWEFGNTSDSLKKIEEDYEKRTKAPLGVEKKDITFYLVTPKLWAYSEPKEKWENSHDDWKEVHIYDAAVLCDWINSIPEVCVWLFEEIFQKNLDFCSVERAWEAFSSKTSPALSESMFLLERESESQQFVSLNDKVIRVKSDYFYDAYGFVLLSIKNNEELKNKYVVVNDYETYKLLSRVIKGGHFLLSFRFYGDAIPENSSVICFGKDATSIRENIKLEGRRRSDYMAIFSDMGIGTNEAGNLFDNSHGDLNSIIRQIPGLSNEKGPTWAEEIKVEYLLPLVILRNFNPEESTGLVEKISGRTIKEITDYYDTFTVREDSPVKKIGEEYILISFEESWAVIGESNHRKRLDISLTILSDIVEGAPDTYWASTSYRSLQESIHNLFRIVLQYSTNGEFSDKDNYTIKKIMEKLFSGSNSYVIDNIYLLADSAPVLFIDTFSHMYRSNKEMVHSWLTTGHKKSYLISAINITSYYEISAIKCCNLLFRLCKNLQDEKIVDDFINALAVILLPWNVNSAISINDKQKLIDNYVEQNEYLGLKIIVSILFTSTYATNSSITKNHDKQEVFLYDLQMFNQHIVKEGVEVAIYKPYTAELKKLLKRYYFLTPEELQKLSEQFDAHIFTENELLELNFELRKVFCRTKNDEDKSIYDDALKSWIEVTSFAEPSTNHCWAFYKSYEFPDIATKSNYYDIEDTEIYAIRKSYLNETYQDFGIDGILNTLKFVSDDFNMSGLLVETIPNEDIYVVLDAFIKKDKYLRAGRIIDSLSREDAEIFISKLNYNQKLSIFGKISRVDLADNLSEEEEKVYWSNKFLTDSSLPYLSKILKYNPFDTIYYSLHNVETNLDLSVSIAKKRFSEFIKAPEKVGGGGISTIEYLINKIDEVYYSEEWAELCLNLYNLFKFEEIPNCVKKLLFNNPELMVEFIEKVGFIPVLFRFELHPSAYEDYGRLSKFVTNLIDNGYKSIAAQTIGRCGYGDDGLFLKENARKILEDVDDDSFDNEVRIGYENKQNARVVADGKDLLKKRYELQQQIPKLLLNYEHTANVVQIMTDGLKRQAERDYLESETSF